MSEPTRKPHSDFPGIELFQPTPKSILRSKTFWVQALALLSMIFPQVRALVAGNPVEAVTALAAINTLVRFATSGRVTIFSERTEKEGMDDWLIAIVIATAITGLCVPCMTHTGPTLFSALI